MRLPRDISGEDLAKGLSAIGYVQTRQSGSRVRLTTHVGGEHHVTIPVHGPLRVATLDVILRELAVIMFGPR